MIALFLQSLMLVLSMMTGAFLVSLVTRTNTVVDFFWSIGFMIVAWYTLYSGDLYVPRQILVTTLVTLWGIRLAGYLLYRNWGKGEDARYAQLAKHWGTNFYLQSFLKVFMLQGWLLTIVSLPVIAINGSLGTPLTLLETLFFVGLWSCGFLFEVIGDWQLQTFLADPNNSGKIMNKGLWHYTRHPNYFGELLMWWSIWGLSLAVPYGIATIIGPLTLTSIILFFSLPLTENQFEDNVAFQEYKKKTSALIPSLPKNTQENRV